MSRLTIAIVSSGRDCDRYLYICIRLRCCGIESLSESHTESRTFTRTSCRSRYCLRSPVGHGQLHLVVPAAETPSVRSVGLLKRDSFRRRLVDVGTQMQGDIKLAKQLQLLGSIQPSVAHHAANKHAVLLVHPGLVLGFESPRTDQLHGHANLGAPALQPLATSMPIQPLNERTVVHRRTPVTMRERRRRCSSPLGRAGWCEEPINGGRAHLQLLLADDRSNLKVAMALQHRQKGGQHRRQTRGTEIIARLPEHLQQLQHIGPMAPATDNSQR